MFDINVTVTLVSCMKSEVSDWRTTASFLKPFKERIEENHYLWPSKTKFYKKPEQYRGCNICSQAFLENGKIGLKGKVLNFNLN